MKTVIDKEGTWEVEKLPSGVEIRKLLKPSQAYLVKLALEPQITEPEPRDIYIEFDQLKEQLKSKGVIK